MLLVSRLLFCFWALYPRASHRLGYWQGHWWALLAPGKPCWEAVGKPSTRAKSTDSTTAPNRGYFLLLRRDALEFIGVDILNFPGIAPSCVGHPGLLLTPACRRSHPLSWVTANSRRNHGVRGDGQQVRSRCQPPTDTFMWHWKAEL